MGTEGRPANDDDALGPMQRRLRTIARRAATAGRGPMYRNVLSPRPAERLTGMQQLLEMAGRDADIRQEALPTFRAAVEAESDPSVAAFAARALARLLGQVQGQAGWFALLARTEAEAMAALADVADAPSSVPALLEMLDRRPELPVRVVVTRALGRSRYPAAVLPALLRCLGDPGLRPHAVEALADLGDAGAIPALESLLAEGTDARPEDDHGPTLRVRDMAAAAIGRIRAGRAGVAPVRPAGASDRAGGPWPPGARHPPLVTRPRAARETPMTEWWLIDARVHAPKPLTPERAAQIVVACRGRVRLRSVFLGTYDEAVTAAARMRGR